MDAAMNSAVSALQAQQAALSTVSDNLANSQTSGYKAVTTQFNSLLTTESVGIGYPSGGVSATARQNLLSQGLVQSNTSNRTTDMAITGNGMFAVSNGLNSGQDFYTRNGAFDTDNAGNLQLSGTNYYLLGWPTDAKGNVLGANPDNIASLQNVNINSFNNTATATTNYSLQANLPAEAQNKSFQMTYTTSDTPPATENISVGYSKVQDNVTVNGIACTQYQVSYTTSDPNAGGLVDNANGYTSQPGQPLVYQVYVDSSGGIQGIVDGTGQPVTTATPNTLPLVGPASSDAASSSSQGLIANGSATGISFQDLGTPFSQNTSISVYDSLGVQESMPVTWAAVGNNQWIMTVNDPSDPSTGKTTGTLKDTGGNPVSSYSYQVTFNSDGTLGSITGLPTFTISDPTTSPPTYTANLDADGVTPSTSPLNSDGGPVVSATWFDGAADSLAGTTTAININLGTAGPLGQGKTDGLSQFDTGETDPAIAVKAVSQNGVQYGQLTGVVVDNQTGNVIASYDNGQKVPIYKVPVVTFPNENGLVGMNDGVYQQSLQSGHYTLNAAGTNGAGAITGQALEQSNVNTSAEFSNMITAQQAYSAASQVIGTDKQMFTSLLQVIQ